MLMFIIEGRLALHLASEYDAHEAVIDTLIDAHPQTLYVMDKCGNTPLDYLKTREGYDIKPSSYNKPKHLNNEEGVYIIDEVEVKPSETATNEQKDILKRLTETIPGYYFQDNVKMSRKSSFSTYSSWFNNSNQDSVSLAFTDDANSLKDEESGTLDLTNDEVLVKPPKQEHRQVLQYWRDIALGLNSGLLSTFLLISGVMGGGMTTRDAFIAGLAGALSGAFVLAISEYLATKCQNDIDQTEIELEKTHITEFHDDEMMELSEIFESIGLYDEGICNLLSEYYVSYFYFSKS